MEGSYLNSLFLAMQSSIVSLAILLPYFVYKGIPVFQKPIIKFGLPLLGLLLIMPYLH